MEGKSVRVCPESPGSCQAKIAHSCTHLLEVGSQCPKLASSSPNHHNCGVEIHTREHLAELVLKTGEVSQRGGEVECLSAFHKPLEDKVYIPHHLLEDHVQGKLHRMLGVVLHAQEPFGDLQMILGL